MGAERQPQLDRLLDVIARLRAPGGCPWDREQTEATMAPHLLEEAFEAIDAIRGGAADAAKEELGDVLMNVVMIAQIASESGRYDIEDVAGAIADKLVRRHPHVFGDVVANDAETVLHNWEAIKQRERRDRASEHQQDGDGIDAETDADARSVLAGVPAALPALLRAFRIGEKAARVGFDWPDGAGPRAKVDEELAELDAALDGDDPDAVAAELGDLLFSVVNLARHRGVNPEIALRATIDKFVARFRHVERELGERLAEASLDEMEALWRAAKDR